MDRISELEAAIRRHRDQRGDDRCWMDDDLLYAILPEGHTPPRADTTVELERCRLFIESRQNPQTLYISPQRRIEELEAKLQNYEALGAALQHLKNANTLDPQRSHKLLLVPSAGDITFTVLADSQEIFNSTDPGKVASFLKIYMSWCD